jgi:hypothetical protein
MNYGLGQQKAEGYPMRFETGIKVLSGKNGGNAR